MKDDSTRGMSIARALAILDLLAESRRPLAGNEIATHLGIPTRTAHRLLDALMSASWVESDAFSGKFQTGPRVTAFASASVAQSRLLHIAKPFLNRVADLTGLNTYLAQRLGNHVVFVDHTQGRVPPPLAFIRGSTYPTHCTSTGKVLLAFLDPATRATLLSGATELRRYTANTITLVSDLEAELASVRSQGYALNREEIREGHNSIALPVFGPDGVVVAAIDVGGGGKTPDELSSQYADLSTIADELSVQLGFLGV